jgi:uroporphyrinogen decarboxylase
MTPKERLLAAVSGSPVDRRPVLLTLSLYGSKLTQCPLSRYHSDARAYAAGQAAVFREFGPDLLLGPFTLAREAAAFGCTLREYEGQAPVVARPAFTSPAALTRRKPPTPDTSTELAWIRDANAATVAAAGPDVPVGGILNSPIDLPALLLGLDAWMETLLTDREAAASLLAYTCEHTAAWANALFAAGTTLIIFPLDISQPGFMPPEVSGELLFPALRRCLSMIAGPVVIHHGGVPLTPALPHLRGIPNLAGLVADPADQFAEMRTLVGDGPVLIGNILGPTLYTMNTNQISRRARAILQDREGDRRFMLGTSGADIPPWTEPEQIHALRAAAEEHAAGVTR